MTVGTAFHARTAPLNAKMQWREWSGYFAASEYHASHVIEYNAIREAAALIDVSPLFKYELRGPDALRLVDRLIVRDATTLAPGRVFYTPWCDEHGKVIDDGTVHRLEDADGGQVIRWTAADPQYRWLRMNAHGLDVDVEDVSERDAAIALQGPLARAVLEAASGEDFADLRYFRPPGLEPRRASPSTSRGPATPATSATSCGSRPTARSRPGTPSWPPASRTGSARPGCSPST